MDIYQFSLFDFEVDKTNDLLDLKRNIAIILLDRLEEMLLMPLQDKGKYDQEYYSICKRDDGFSDFNRGEELAFGYCVRSLETAFNKLRREIT